MRTSHIVLALIVSLVACSTTTTVSSTSSSTIAHWQTRDISELVATIGPFDTTSIHSDSRSYDWFRFGNCHLRAQTDLDNKIQKVEVEGTGQGCDVYLDKLRS
jgi:hypothetical protein